jgi:excisionase family DNA binding protein
MQAQSGHSDMELTENQPKKKAQRINNPLYKRLLTLKEAAAFLGVGIWTMRDIVWSGSVPLVRFRRRMYFDVRDLEQLIERNKVTYN